MTTKRESVKNNRGIKKKQKKNVTTQLGEPTKSVCDHPWEQASGLTLAAVEIPLNNLSGRIQKTASPITPVRPSRPLDKRNSVSPLEEVKQTFATAPFPPGTSVTSARPAAAGPTNLSGHYWRGVGSSRC